MEAKGAEKAGPHGPPVFGLTIAGVYLLLIIFNISMTGFWFTGFLNPRNVLYKVAYTALGAVLCARVLLMKKCPAWILLALQGARSVWSVASALYFAHFADFITVDIVKTFFLEGMIASGMYKWTGEATRRIFSHLLEVPLSVAAFLLSGRIKEWFHGLRWKPAIVARRAVVIASCAGLLSAEAYNATKRVSICHLLRYGDPYYYSSVLKYGAAANLFIQFFHGVLFNPGQKDYYAGLDRYETESAAKPRSLVFIQVESLDSGLRGSRVGGKPVTPFLDSAADEGFYAPVMVVNTGAGTLNSEICVINSFVPDGPMPPNHDYPNSLAAALKRAGYSTMAFHGNSGTFYSRNRVYRRMGFDAFYDKKDIGGGTYKWGSEDKDTFSFALEKMRASTGPFLAYIITMSSHNPFDLLPPEVRAAGGIRTGDAFVDSYFGSLAYVDGCLGVFVEELRKIAPDAIVCIYGDHPAFIEKPVYRSSQIRIGQNIVRYVPLFILGEGIAPGSAIIGAKAVSLVDVAPTMATLCGAGIALETGGEILLKGELMKSIPYQGTSLDRAIVFDEAMGALGGKGWRDGQSR